MTKEEFIKQAKEYGYTDDEINEMESVVNEGYISYEQIPLSPQINN